MELSAGVVCGLAVVRSVLAVHAGLAADLPSPPSVCAQSPESAPKLSPAIRLVTKKQLQWKRLKIVCPFICMIPLIQSLRQVYGSYRRETNGRRMEKA